MLTAFRGFTALSALSLVNSISKVLALVTSGVGFGGRYRPEDAGL